MQRETNIPQGPWSGVSGYQTIWKILKEYYDSCVEQYGRELKDEEGTDMWPGLGFSFLDPELIDPLERSVRNGDLSGLMRAVYKSLTEEDAFYPSTLMALLEMCAELPADENESWKDSWYQATALDILEEAREAGAVTERTYRKIKKNLS